MIADENVAPQLAKATSKTGKGGKTIEETYQKKTQLEHILLRPDTYIGSIEAQTQPAWIYDQASGEIVNKTITFVPGLYKIYDEILVNAADNKQRDPSMSKIEISIDPDENTIRVWNNGKGIPVCVHEEHKIYVPELIFGNLLTGSNFDDEQAKTTGGRNGYGAKLANIFSTEFTVETADSSRGLYLKQVFTKNMTQRTAPEVKKHSGTDFTCITFKPDLKRFKMEYMDDDTVGLLCKRAYDIAGTNCGGSPRLNVVLNGKKIEVKNFEQYITLYKGLSEPVAFERINDRWEIGVGISDGTFQQVSFVNSICTMKGGQHVQYIADQVANRLVATVKKKNKGQEIKISNIKNHLAIYVNALVVNPAFDSQTKENLTTKVSQFGSTCTVSEKIFKAVEKSGIVDNILSWAKFKQNAELKKKGGSKKSKLIGITKLDDANFAGSAKSANCTLILTEGDSAKALAMSGLGVVGRDYYGVFPLKGKLLNVREATHAQIMKNEEIQNIAKILGLSFGREYEDISSLRYGHLMIMTDQDHDGSHIKGLLINFLHHFWPSLLKIEGFLQQFITPIVKCTKGKKELTFFTIPEYTNWKEVNGDGRGWKIKYYKGLGTSTSAEAKEYFSNLQTHEINFKWDENADDVIDMAFSKARVSDRKQWLLAMEPGIHIDYSVENVSYDNFVNHELILFSHADNERSIPHFMDGMKPSQRKVLYACFKRNLKQEIKVAQLAGYISEHSAYHHGEASLTQTIIGMAQNFVGSNNINLLSPCGQFGTRLMGGKDAASPRYVFTKLEAITRCIFHPDDDPLLTYLDDDGQSIEPVSYIPIIPMVLVNGSDGIGTGWSSSVPTYNPREIIENIRSELKGDGMFEMHPWYRGFTGDITAKTGKDSGNYVVSGILEQVDDTTIMITELPVKKWTTDYKQMLETMVIGAEAKKEEGAAAGPPQIIKDFKENHTDTSVLFTVSLPPEKMIESIQSGLQKRFKLDSSIATSNMHMFDFSGQIKKFESVQEIMSAFMDVRLEYYDRRKVHLLGKLTEEWERLDNKVKFILAVVQGSLIVSNRKKTELLQDLKSKGFKTFFPKKKGASAGDSSENNDGEEHEEEEIAPDSLDRGYDYLLSMKIWSLTMEKVQSLTAERDSKKDELDVLSAKNSSDLWLADLDALEEALDVFEAEIEEAKDLENKAMKKANKAGKGSRAIANGKAKAAQKSKGKKAKHYDSSDEEDSMSEDDFSEDEEFDSDYSEEATKPPKKAPVVKAKPLGISGGGSAAPKARVALQPVSNSMAIKKTVIPPASGSTQAATKAQPSVAKASVNVSVVKPPPIQQKEDAVLNSAPMSLAERLMFRAKAEKSTAQSTLTIKTTSHSDWRSGAVDLTGDDTNVLNTELKDNKKRVPKLSQRACVSDDVYSPGISTPPENKKCKAKKANPTHQLDMLVQDQDGSPVLFKSKAAVKVTKPAVTKVQPKAKIAAAPKATKSAPKAAPKKTVAPKKKAFSSDDEDDDDDEYDEDEVHVAPKILPSRQRKPVSYAYDDESDEAEFDEEEEDISEDDDSDFD